MNKDRFVCEMLIRANPPLDKVVDGIKHAEAVYAILLAHGYASNQPDRLPQPAIKLGFDGLPVAKLPQPETAYPYHNHQRPKDPATLLQEARADERHWRKLLELKPNDEAMQAIHAAATAKLAQLENPQ